MKTALVLAMCLVIAIGYQNRGTMYVIMMSLYTRFINWKN